MSNRRTQRTRYAMALLVMAAVSSAVMTTSAQEWPSWPPGTCIGYAEDGHDMTPNSYYDYYGTFNESGERVWFHWEEENFALTHESHYFTVYAWVATGLDVAIGAVRNIYYHEFHLQTVMEDDGGQGHDEILCYYYWYSEQHNEQAWYDDQYCSVWVYCQSGSGSVHVRIYVGDS